MIGRDYLYAMFGLFLGFGLDDLFSRPNHPGRAVLDLVISAMWILLALLSTPHKNANTTT